MKIEKITGPSKVLLFMGRRTSAHREDCPQSFFEADLKKN